MYSRALVQKRGPCQVIWIWIFIFETNTTPNNCQRLWLLKIVNPNWIELNFALETTNCVPNGRFAKQHKPTPLGPWNKKERKETTKTTKRRLIYMSLILRIWFKKEAMRCVKRTCIALGTDSGNAHNRKGKGKDEDNGGHFNMKDRSKNKLKRKCS